MKKIITAITIIVLLLGFFAMGYRYGYKKTIVINPTPPIVTGEMWMIYGDYNPKKVKIIAAVIEKEKPAWADSSKNDLRYWDWHDQINIDQLYLTRDSACKITAARIKARIQAEQDQLNMLDCGEK